MFQVSLPEENVPAKAAKAGQYLTGKLTALKEKHAFVKEVRGMGLLVGLEMKDNRAAPVIRECLDNGLLLNAVRPNTLRFMPPLTVSNAEIDQAVKVLDAALSKVPAPA